MRLLLLATAALTLAACCIQLPPSRPTPLPEDPNANLGTPLWPEGALELGTTDTTELAFVPIGAQLELHRGPQGGYHSFAKYLVRGQTSSNATFENRVRRQRDGLLVSRGSITAPVDPGDAGAWTSENVFMFLCPTSAGVNIVGEPLVFEVTAKDTTGAFLGRASATAVLDCQQCQADCGG